MTRDITLFFVDSYYLIYLKKREEKRRMKD